MKPAGIAKHARRVVRDAEEDGALDRGELTMHAAREAVLQRMGMAPDAADDDKELRDAIKKAVREAIAELEADDGDGDEEGGDGEGGEKSEGVLSSPSKPGTDAPEEADVIEDAEDLANSPSPSSSLSSVYDEPPKRPKGKAGKRAKPTPSRSRSDSLSSVADDPPPKKRAKKGKATKDPNEGLSPEEARVADLKRIVVACGVRKQWGKELGDCTTTGAQVAHLKNLLSSLGMKGQPTLGKAKALKERREMAQELNDVREYEAQRGVSAGRPRRGRKDPDEEEDRTEAAGGAMAAVLDFLGDDSD